MANNVFLDAMIMRADFGDIPEKEEATTKIVSLSLEGLKSTSYLVHQLRKPDFQRETNHWTPLQVVTFLKSFLDRELVLSIILGSRRAMRLSLMVDTGSALSEPGLRTTMAKALSLGNATRMRSQPVSKKSGSDAQIGRTRDRKVLDA